ncbi:MAG: hypothetical protein EOO98_14900, partial [Pedobacter sp.]
NIKKILRVTQEKDLEKHQQAVTRDLPTMYRVREISKELKLQMKVSDVEFQSDNTKATFYYSADDRVDFRELIKLLAAEFKIRVEMKQISLRQEAARVGGIGSCGRELCCSTWLTDFKTVSTSAARYQNLSLNTLKLAGQCGKLKCCLNYELDTYMDALKAIPDNVDRLKTVKGEARWQKTDIFKKLMWFSYFEDNTWIPLHVDRVKEIQEMNKNGQKPDDLKDHAALLEELVKEEKSFDYENVVGQDSLTRLDEKARNKNKNNRNKQKSRSTGGAPQQEQKTGQQPQRTSQPQQQPQKANQPQQNRNANSSAPAQRPQQQQQQKPKQQNAEGAPANAEARPNKNNRNKKRRPNNNGNANKGPAEA